MRLKARAELDAPVGQVLHGRQAEEFHEAFVQEVERLAHEAIAQAGEPAGGIDRRLSR